MTGALCAAAAVLLMWSGLAKLVRPAATAGMLAEVVGRAWPGRRTVARLVGVVEACVGGAVLVHGGRPAYAALAACYLAFTVVALRLTIGPRPAPCGCFGRSDAATGWLHVTVDAVACAAGVVATLAPPGAWGGFGDQPALVEVVGLGQVVLLAAMGYLLVTALPSVLADRERVVSRT